MGAVRQQDRRCGLCISAAGLTSVVLLLGACFQATPAECVIRCANDLECPHDLSCNAAGLCDGPGGSTCGAIGSGRDGDVIGRTDGGNTIDDAGANDADAGVLSTADLVVRYYLDEDDNGFSIDSIADSGELPTQNLAVLVDADGTYPEYTTDAQGNLGLLFSGDDHQSQAVNRQATPLKISSRLDDSQRMTIELVVDPELLSATSPNVVLALGIGTGDDDTVVVDVSGDGVAIMISTSVAAQTPTRTLCGAPVTFAGRSVVHLVFDGPSFSSENRLRLYVGGTRVNLWSVTLATGGALPIAITGPCTLPANSQLYVPSTSRLSLGNSSERPPAGAFEGTLYYAAIYEWAFGQYRAGTHSNFLSVTDDGPPP